MALMGNRTRLGTGAYRVVGIAPDLSRGYTHQGVGWSNWIRQDLATEVLNLAAKPTGYYAPSAYKMPIVAGEMASTVEGEGDASGAMGAAINIDAALTGSGDITNAELSLIVQAVATLTGSGDLAGTLDGLLNCVASVGGSGTVSGAVLNGLGNMTSGVTGSGSVTAVINALGNMAADITVTGTGLTTANVAASVWNALAATHNSAGTMGALLNAISTPTMFSGGATAGASTTITLDGTASSIDDYYVHGMILLSSGTGAGQARRIIDYDGASRVVTVAPAWATNPDGTTDVLVLPFPHVHVAAADAAALLPHLIAAGLIV